MYINLAVGNLGKYNEGELVYEWVTLPCDLEELFVKIGVGQYDSEGNYKHGVEEGWSFYEEYHIQDSETDIHGLEISEYSNLKRLNELAEELEGLSSEKLKHVEYIMNTGEYPLSEAIEMAIEGEGNKFRLYTGCEDYYDLAKMYLDMTGGLDEIPKHLQRFFNFAEYGEEMFSDATKVDDRVWIEFIY